MSNHSRQLCALIERVGRGDALSLVEASALVSLISAQTRARDALLSALLGQVDVALALTRGESPSMHWVTHGPLQRNKAESAAASLERLQHIADVDAASSSTLLAMRALVEWILGRPVRALGLLEKAGCEISLARSVRALITAGSPGPAVK